MGKKKPRITKKAEAARKYSTESEDFLTYPSRKESRNAEVSQRELIGDRIGKIREMHSLTLNDLCSRTGISVDCLRKVESNERIPALGEIVKLSKALQTRISYLVSPAADKSVSIVRTNQRRPVSRYGEKRSERYGYSYESLAPEKANRSMEPFIVTLTPTDVEEPSAHDGQEFIFVLEGQIMVQIIDTAEVLGPGDSLYYDSSQPHLIKCADGNEARILAVIYLEPK